MRDPPGKGPSRAETVSARPDGLLRARAQRRRRAGHRAQKSRPGPAHVLRADPSARYRAQPVSLDTAELPLRLPARLCSRDVYADAPEPGKPAVTPLALLLS